MARDPLYRQAEREMLDRIADGRWPVGTRLPNEFVLAEEFGVSQGTMRRALISVEEMGHLARKPGRGTEVVPRRAVPAPSARLCLPHGEEPVFHIHRESRTRRRGEGAENALFGAGRVQVITRLLTCEDDRSATEEIAVPEDLAPGLPRELPGALTEILAALEIPYAVLEEEVGAAVTTMAESVALQCDRHTPLLMLVRVARDADGAPVARQVLKVAIPGLTCRFTL